MNCDTPPAEPEGYRFVRRRGAGIFRSPERPAFANSGKSGQKRRQKPMVFGGVLFHISFAVERNMATGGKCRTRVQPAIVERKTGRRGRRPLRRIRREYTGIRWCADAGRRGRRPLRRDRREYAGIRGCADTGRRGRRPCGVRDRRHDEIRVGGVCPSGAFKRGTRERVAFSGRM